MARRSVPCMVVAVLLVASTARAGTSNSLMDLTPDGGRLLVANPDNGTVTVVDTATRKVLREIPVGHKPEGVTWLGAGPRAAITLYRDNRVVLLDTQQGRVLQRWTVPDEPYGIVANRAGTRVWITHDYPGLVVELDPETGKLVRQLKAGAFVRGLALTPDEGRLYVTEFYTAALHALDLQHWAIVDTWPGRPTDNLCRNVVLHPRRPKAFLTQLRSRIEVAHGNGSIFPQLSICTLTAPAEGVKRRAWISLDSFNDFNVVNNPWEAAVSPDGTRLYTLYAGSNDLNVSRILDDDYQEIERVGQAVRVGQNPKAIRLSPDGRTIYVYNALDFAVSIHQAEDMKRLATVTVCAPPKTAEWVRGKILFSTADPPLTVRRWISCASCHPDGQGDGRVWQNPEGLRKTPALFGLAHTHPLHWSADRDEVQDFEYTIRGPLMQGRGLLSGALLEGKPFAPVALQEHLAGRSKDLDALAIYTNSFDFTLSPHIPAPGKLAPAAERGKQLFFSKNVGCASCHSGPYYTDSSLTKPFNLHDVGTGGDDPTERMGPKYDTPTLLGVYRTAPYLHHGKAKSLLDVLTTCNQGDRHGKTSHLKADALDDLVEFLKSLPYEMPPSETPNTVKYRVTGSEPGASATGIKQGR